MSERGPTAVATKGIAERLRLALFRLVERWKESSPSQQQKLLISAALTLLTLSALLVWGFRPVWKVLYSNLTPEDSRAIASILSTAGITYDVSADGTSLRVAAGVLDKARLATAAKAGGRTGRAGFEIFDKPNWAGSDFDEKVNYQRALEGELEHTIEGLGDVASARVHLVLPHDALFLEQQRDAKASVVLRLRTSHLGSEEAESIRTLIASAVDDLKPENVVLVDAEGRSAFGKKDSAEEAKAAFEQTLADHVIQTLEPVAGEGNVRATVTAEFETSSTDELDERYDPSAVVALSMQRSEQSSGHQALAEGVPGTTTNAPNQQPLPLFPSKISPTDSNKEESGTYGASKKTVHLIQGPGKLHRVNVAVVLNNRPTSVTSKDPASQQSWSSDELKQFALLTQAAVGYDGGRGDQVVVRNLQFRDVTQDKPTIVGRLMRARGLFDPVLRYSTITGLIAILLIFVLRPLILGQPAGSPLERGGDKALPGIKREILAAGQNQHPSQLLFEQVADHVQRDPAQSARILQSWIKAE